MANQDLIDNWRRGQMTYPQARYFTPGRQTTQVSAVERGQAQRKDLLVVIHNDVQPAALGQQRIDVIIHSGGSDRPAEYPNGHLVNVYDERAGITDHTALYSDADLARIHAGSRGPVVIPAQSAGPPGAEVYSVNGALSTNHAGQLIIDTTQPLEPGPVASRYSLHDVQQGMDLTAQQGAPQVITEVPAHGDNAVQSETTAIEAPSTVLPRNSQAGLATHRESKNSFPSVPKPGEPGSRFNPRVRERVAQPQQSESSNLIQAEDVPKPEPAADKPRKQLRMPTGEEISALNRIGQEASRGAKRGAEIGRTVPKIGATFGGIAGGVIGAGHGLAKEVERRPGDTAVTASKPSESYDYQFETDDSAPDQEEQYG